MSDTEEELMPNDVFKYPHERKNTFNSSNFAVHNHYKNFDLRSLGSRRETSSMSLKSFQSSRMHYKQGYYPTAMSSQGSVYNERCRSPMSGRSIDSSVSLSAADIASAIKNLKCNRKELRLVQDAYKMYIKKFNRRRIEKRRNLKSFMRQFKKRSGGDSGEEGSDSSISSDDCRSTRSAFYTENVPLPRSQSVRNIHEVMDKIKEHDLYKDCTKTFQQTTFTYNASSQNKRPNNIQTSNNKLQSICNDKNIAEEKNTSVSLLKDRFANTSSVMLLPSERFTTKPNSIQELSNKDVITHIQKDLTNSKNCESDSGNEEIFSHPINRLNLSLQRKRLLETENSCPSKKRIKSLNSPKRQHAGPSLPKLLFRNNENNDFPFKKPQIPAKKSNHNHNPAISKDATSEILLAKCNQPLVGNVISTSNQLNHISQLDNNKDEDVTHIKKKSLTQNYTETVNDTNCTELTLNSTDVSTKPSFIKRKLFTQKLDVVENNNASSDNLGVNSPKTKLVRACREKNKVRKLVTSQSCLSRDVTTDDNVLDLIHKIVPAHQMNATNVANKQADTNHEKQNRDDKWDVTSVLSMCNNEDASDTYTDEEIFNALHNEKKKCKDISIHNDVKKSPKLINNLPKQQEKENVGLICKLVIEKLPIISNFQDSEIKEKTNSNKKTASTCVKSFWDTDFESDLEDQPGLPWKSRFQDFAHMKARKNDNFIEKKKNGLRCTTITVKNFQNNVTNSSKREITDKQQKSDISNVPNYNSSDIHQKNTENNNELLNKRQKQIKAKQEKRKENSITKNDAKRVNSKLQNGIKAINGTNKTSEKCKLQNNVNHFDSPQTIFNKSRESIRLKEKREAKQKCINSMEIKSPQVALNKFNISRESLRKKKRS